MKLRIYNLVILFLTGILMCQAQTDPRITAYLKAKEAGTPLTSLDELFPQWQLSKMKNLCTIVSGRMVDKSIDGDYKYLYQRRIYEAAKVDKSRESKEAAAKKIADMWGVCEKLNLLNCNSTQFDVMDGNLLKYAVSYRFTEFIDDAIRWGLPLNKIDYTDNRTLLYYVDYHAVKNKGNALEELFQVYYDKLRSAGAKHRTELVSEKN